MSDNVVNLRQARKSKARSEKDKKADENRHLHGRTKAQKQAEEHQKSRAKELLDGHKREQDT